MKLKHRHENKLVNLLQDKRKLYDQSNTLFPRSTAYNYSSYNFSIEEEEALSFGLYQHIPITINSNNLHMYSNVVTKISQTMFLTC